MSTSTKGCRLSAAEALHARGLQHIGITGGAVDLAAVTVGKRGRRPKVNAQMRRRIRQRNARKG